jgi:hypothetical protein
MRLSHSSSGHVSHVCRIPLASNPELTERTFAFCQMGTSASSARIFCGCGRF